MLLTAIAIVLCAATIVALRRLIVVMLSWGMMALGVAFAGRVAILIDGRLAERDWAGPLILGGFGAFVVLLLGYRQIHNMLVDADLRRQIERDKQQSAARRI